MRALNSATTRSANVWSFGIVAIASSLGGYLAVRTEMGYAAGGAFVLLAAAAVWLLTGERHWESNRARSTVTHEVRLFRVPRAAFLTGLLLIGQLSVRPIYATTASDYFFFAAFVMTLGALLISGRVRGFLPDEIIVGACVFALGACLSAVVTDTVSASLGVTLRVLYLTLIWFWVATVLLRRVSDVRLGVCFWVTSIAVSGTAAIAQLLLGDVIPGTDTAFGRMTGTAQHVNDLGGSAAVALPAAAGLVLLSDAGRPIRLVGAFGTLLIASGLVLSGSIGGMLAAGFGMGVAAVVAKRKRSFGIAAVAIAAATLVTWHFQKAEDADTILGRIDAVSGPSGSLIARLDVFQLAWTQVAERPLIGVGFGFDPTSAGAQIPDLIHNAFLSVWYQGGLLALVGLLIICLTSVRVGLRVALDSGNSDELMLAGSLVGSFAGYLVLGFSEPTLYLRYGWVPVALLFALRAIQQEKLRRGVPLS